MTRECPRCKSDTCPGRDEILECTAEIDGNTATLEAITLMLERYVQDPGPRLYPNAPKWAEARCSLPGCGATLHMEITQSRAIYLRDTALDLRDGEGHTEAWSVTCENGHVLLLPEADADSIRFGECRMDADDHEPGDVCPCDDLDRLRAVAAQEVFP